MLYSNPDASKTVYLGYVNAIKINGVNTIPLGPGQAIPIDGGTPVWAIGTTGTAATVVVPGGSNLFLPTSLSGIGGAAVYVQSSAPTGTIPTNSIWFDTANNSLQTWNGSAWVNQQFDANQLIEAATILSAQIASQAVTAAKIANNTITASQVANGTLTTAQLAAAAGILGSQIASATITSGNIAANTIVAGNIAANTITASQLAAGIIYAGIVNGTTISAATFMGTNWIENSSGSFFYNGTPGDGTLAFSIAPANGSDASWTGGSGNNYYAGINAYNFTPGTGGNAISVTQLVSNPALNGVTGSINPSSNATGLAIFQESVDSSNNAFGQLVLAAPGVATTDDVAQGFAVSGNAAATTTPYWQFSSAQADSTTYVDNLGVAGGEAIGVYSTAPAYWSYGNSSSQHVVTFNSGSGHWTVPSGVTSVTVQCWGAGGGSAGSAAAPSGGAEGGGGGAYASSILTVTPGASIPYSVGSGGAGGTANNLGHDGTQTTFNTSSVIAKPGLAATLSSVGLGGTAAASTGNSKHNGGNGGSASGTGGSGGGSSAGSSAGGNNGGSVSGSTGGAGGAAPAQGGAGGNGGSAGGSGNAGGSPGAGAGGPGGGSVALAGSAGANGRIILTYTASGATTLVASQAGASGTDAANGMSNAFAQGFTGNIAAFTPSSSPTTVETWHTASLGTNFSGTIQYKLNADNTVSLRGENVNTGTTSANAALFTLPSGYRPTATFAFLTPNNMSGYTAPARVISIATSGVVTVVPSGANTNFFLCDNIRFPVD